MSLKNIIVCTSCILFYFIGIFIQFNKGSDILGFTVSIFFILGAFYLFFYVSKKYESEFINKISKSKELQSILKRIADFLEKLSVVCLFSTVIAIFKDMNTYPLIVIGVLFVLSLSLSLYITKIISKEE